jgi:glycerol-3-phosphate acyltransferase PlsY
MYGYVILFLAGYFLGAVPFAYVVAKLAAGVDIRTVGSGNVGASNVRRAVGNTAGIAVLILDIGKGFVPVHFFPDLLAPALPQAPAAVVCALGAVLGHVFTVFLKFRGGKGVATSCGVALGLAPLPAAIALATFAGVVAVWRYISLGSMAAAGVFLVGSLLLEDDPLGANLPVTGLAVAVVVLIVVRHRTNIQRLLAGTENKVGQDRQETSAKEVGEETSD